MVKVKATVPEQVTCCGFFQSRTILLPDVRILAFAVEFRDLEAAHNDCVVANKGG